MFINNIKVKQPENYVHPPKIKWGRTIDEEIDVWKTHILPQRGIPTFEEALKSHYEKERTKKQVSQEEADKLSKAFITGQGINKYVLAVLNPDDTVNYVSFGKEGFKEMLAEEGDNLLKRYIKETSKPDFDYEKMGRKEKFDFEYEFIKDIKSRPYKISKTLTTDIENKPYKYLLVNTQKGKGRKIILDQVIPYLAQSKVYLENLDQSVETTPYTTPSGTPKPPKPKLILSRTHAETPVRTVNFGIPTKFTPKKLPFGSPTKRVQTKSINEKDELPDESFDIIDLFGGDSDISSENRWDMNDVLLDGYLSGYLSGDDVKSKVDAYENFTKKIENERKKIEEDRKIREEEQQLKTKMGNEATMELENVLTNYTTGTPSTRKFFNKALTLEPHQKKKLSKLIVDTVEKRKGDKVGKNVLYKLITTARTTPAPGGTTTTTTTTTTTKKAKKPTRLGFTDENVVSGKLLEKPRRSNRIQNQGRGGGIGRNWGGYTSESDFYANIGIGSVQKRKKGVI